jgi:hypothetical protein
MPTPAAATGRRGAYLTGPVSNSTGFKGAWDSTQVDLKGPSPSASTDGIQVSPVEVASESLPGGRFEGHCLSLVERIFDAWEMNPRLWFPDCQNG